MQKYKIFLIVFLLVLIFIKSDSSLAQEKLILPNGFALIVEERKEPPLVYLHGRRSQICCKNFTFNLQHIHRVYICQQNFVFVGDFGPVIFKVVHEFS